MTMHAGQTWFSDVTSFTEKCRLTIVVQYFACTICDSFHYEDIIMGPIASQITSLTIVYLTVYSDAEQRKHKSFASPAFVGEFNGDRWITRTNGQ